MREPNEFLTEEEIYIIKHHPSMTYKSIGEKLGISISRVRRLKVNAERKLQEEGLRESAELKDQASISFTLGKKEVCCIIKSLYNQQIALLSKRADKRRKKESSESCYEDVELKLTEELISYFRNTLNS